MCASANDELLHPSLFKDPRVQVPEEFLVLGRLGDTMFRSLEPHGHGTSLQDGPRKSAVPDLSTNRTDRVRTMLVNLTAVLPRICGHI